MFVRLFAPLDIRETKEYSRLQQSETGIDEKRGLRFVRWMWSRGKPGVSKLVTKVAGVRPRRVGKPALSHKVKIIK